MNDAHLEPMILKLVALTGKSEEWVRAQWEQYQHQAQRRRNAASLGEFYWLARDLASVEDAKQEQPNALLPESHTPDDACPACGGSGRLYDFSHFRGHTACPDCGGTGSAPDWSELP